MIRWSIRRIARDQENGQEAFLLSLLLAASLPMPLASVALLSVVTAHRKRIGHPVFSGTICPLNTASRSVSTYVFQRMSFNVVGASITFFFSWTLNSSAVGISFNFLIASTSPVDVSCAAIGSPTLTRESIFVSGVTRM